LEKHSLLEWQRLFGAIGQDSNMTALAPEEFEVVKERTLQQPTTFGINPQKQLQRCVELEDSLWGSENQDGEGEISPIGTRLYNTDLDTLLAAQLDKVLNFSQSIAINLARFKEVKGKDIDTLEFAVQDIDAKMGRDPGLSDTPLLTTWEGIAFANSAAQESNQSVGALQNEMAILRHNMATQEKRLASFAGIPGTLSWVEGNMNQVTTLMNLLVQENAKLWTELRVAQSITVPAQQAQGVNNLKEALWQVEARLGAAEARIIISSGSLVASSSPGTPPQHPSYLELLERFQT